MKTGTFYLNNIGSKWVIFKDGLKIQIWAYINGELVKRTPLYFGKIYDTTYVRICYQGRQIEIFNFADSPEKLNAESDNNIIRMRSGIVRA